MYQKQTTDSNIDEPVSVDSRYISHKFKPNHNLLFFYDLLNWIIVEDQNLKL
jgi:hypothetical protein